MIMPFGKYKGISVRDIPSDYLEWLWGNVPLYDPLWSLVKEELEGLDIDVDEPFGDAGNTNGPKTKPRPTRIECGLTPMEADMVREIVSRGYRECAKIYHPDIGGTHKQMTALNSANEKCLSIIGLS